MKNTLRIGEAIYQILKEFKNVYPLVADEGTKFPFIIYKRSSGYTQSAKDGLFTVVANIDILVAAQSYEASIELADKVLTKLESSRGIIADYNIHEIRMIDSNEIWMDNTFVQNLKMKVEFSVF